MATPTSKSSDGRWLMSSAIGDFFVPDHQPHQPSAIFSYPAIIPISHRRFFRARPSAAPAIGRWPGGQTSGHRSSADGRGANHQFIRGHQPSAGSGKKPPRFSRSHRDSNPFAVDNRLNPSAKSHVQKSKKRAIVTQASQVVPHPSTD